MKYFVASFALIVLVACSSPTKQYEDNSVSSEWQEHVSEGGSFSILFPATSEIEARDSNGEKGSISITGSTISKISYQPLGIDNQNVLKSESFEEYKTTFTKCAEGQFNGYNWFEFCSTTPNNVHYVFLEKGLNKKFYTLTLRVPDGISGGAFETLYPFIKFD